jgi:hypothetical protein
MNEIKSQNTSGLSLQHGTPSSTRRAYREPVLQVFGKMHQLTQSGSGMNMEGASGMAAMM